LTLLPSSSLQEKKKIELRKIIFFTTRRFLYVHVNQFFGNNKEKVLLLFRLKAAIFYPTIFHLIKKIKVLTLITSMQFINLFFTINHTFVLKLEKKMWKKRRNKKKDFFFCNFPSIISQAKIIFLLSSIYSDKVEAYVHWKNG
jgi:hypothetical protein